jgi:hypothetical protein
MYKVELYLSEKQFFNCINYCIEHFVSSWRTVKGNNSYYFSCSAKHWKKQLDFWNQLYSWDDKIIIPTAIHKATFAFYKPEDAMLFKLMWC